MKKSAFLGMNIYFIRQEICFNLLMIRKSNRNDKAKAQKLAAKRQ